MISRYERLTSTIAEISRHINRISTAVMKEYGLRGSWAKYLLVLKRHPAGITAARICNLCERNKADVSRSLAELEELGLISKLSGGSYRARLALTERGVEIANKLEVRANELIAFVGNDISDCDRELLYTSLDSIAKNLEAIKS